MTVDSQNTSSGQNDKSSTPKDPDSARQPTHAEPVIGKRPNDPNWLGVGAESDGEASERTPEDASSKPG